MQYLKFATENHVATVTLERPEKLNAVSPEMTDEIREVVATINTTADIRSVVLTGTGKAFCAGSDIAELDTYPNAWEFRDRPDYCDAIRSIKKPVVAAVNGYAFGGGLEMAMSCDIRLASQNAVFGSPEIKLGWIGGGGMAAFLVHSIGPSNAATMLYTGDPIDAEKALTWGLISDIADPEELLARAQALATTIATRAPIAAQTAKKLLASAHSLSITEAIEYERDLQTITFATEDAAEGRQAFKEKREPQFSGK